MIDSLEQLVHALREELQQYGEMLARLDDQQERVMRRDAVAVLEIVPAVQEQTGALTSARAFRAGAMNKVCAALNLAVDAAFELILPLVPENYRLLIGALVQENNSLLYRVQQRVRQNHLLLTRTVDSMQRVINSLGHHQPTFVYNGTGGMFAPAPITSRLYEAVG